MVDVSSATKYNLVNESNMWTTEQTCQSGTFKGNKKVKLGFLVNAQLNHTICKGKIKLLQQKQDRLE